MRKDRGGTACTEACSRGSLCRGWDQEAMTSSVLQMNYWAAGHLSPQENLGLLPPSPGGSDQCPSSVLLSAFASR